MPMDSYSKIDLIADLKEIVSKTDGATMNSNHPTSPSKPPREYTLEEIGQELGVTREWVRQIEAKALKRLQHFSRSKILKPFADE